MEHYRQTNQKLLYAKKDSVTGAWSQAFNLQSNFTFVYNKKIHGQFQEKPCSSSEELLTASQDPRDMEKMLHAVYLNVVIGHRDNAK